MPRRLRHRLPEIGIAKAALALHMGDVTAYRDGVLPPLQPLTQRIPKCRLFAFHAVNDIIQVDFRQ